MRVERAKRKISQLNLATKAGISPDTVNMIERGVGNPTLFTIISIAKALDVDLNTLIPLK
ncbi:TPA: helix-turn-helix transcriptional regulator [Candidatus Scatousia excrementigallinarum]|uniref:Helix-turn-helix transcriptional regulator n=1 Tax=Candidatus Scatousia excrementigallinarum TaxID=2840935 RepID=A0A9D1JNW3_9BACT|nr:helix-turn-helix transcriptional regulator [Candidatus Scatousia excrementigallinarum]